MMTLEAETHGVRYLTSRSTRSVLSSGSRRSLSRRSTINTDGPDPHDAWSWCTIGAKWLGAPLAIVCSVTTSMHMPIGDAIFAAALVGGFLLAKLRSVLRVQRLRAVGTPLDRLPNSMAKRWLSALLSCGLITRVAAACAVLLCLFREPDLAVRQRLGELLLLSLGAAIGGVTWASKRAFEAPKARHEVLRLFFVGCGKDEIFLSYWHQKRDSHPRRAFVRAHSAPFYPLSNAPHVAVGAKTNASPSRRARSRVGSLSMRRGWTCAGCSQATSRRS